MSESPTVTVTIRIPKQYHCAIRDMATTGDRSLNAEIVRALREYVASRPIGTKAAYPTKTVKCDYPGHGYHSGECPKSRKAK